MRSPTQVSLILLAACATRVGSREAAAPAATVTATPAPRPSPPQAVSPPQAPIPPPAPSPPPLPPLPALLADGSTLHLLVVEGATARCTAWVVAPEPTLPAGFRLTRSETRGSETHSVSYHFERTTGGLVLRSAERATDQGYGGAVFGRSASCSGGPQAITVHGTTSVAVAGSEWFARADDCEAARAASAPVATAFGDCELALDEPSDDDAIAGMARFERLLARGGTMYYLEVGDDDRPACVGWKVAPTKRGVPAGEWSRTTRDGKVRETTSYDYEWQATSSEPGGGGGPSVTVSGPGGRRTDAQGQTEEWAMGCADVATVLGRDRDSIELDGPTYLTRAACQRDAAAAKARLTWLPPPADGDGDRLAALTGGIPGC